MEPANSSECRRDLEGVSVGILSVELRKTLIHRRLAIENALMEFLFGKVWMNLIECFTPRKGQLETSIQNRNELQLHSRLVAKLASRLSSLCTTAYDSADRLNQDRPVRGVEKP